MRDVDAGMELIRRNFNAPGESRCRTVHLGDDEWGAWLLIPAGTIHFVDAQGPGTQFEPFYALACPALVLAPPGRWWIAHFTQEAWKVDICSPVVRTETSIEWEDLRLDVESPPGGPALITDQDEFEELVLDETTTAEAWAAAKWAATAIDSGADPFGNARNRWAQAMGRPVDSVSASGGVLKLHPGDEGITSERFGSDVVASWKARQTAGQGLVLIALAAREVVGLAWAPRPGADAPAAQIIGVDDRIRESSLHEHLDRATHELGVHARAT